MSKLEGAANGGDYKNSLKTLLRADLLRLWGRRSAPNGVRLWMRLLHPRFVPVLLLRLSAKMYTWKMTKPLALFLSLINFVFFGLEVTPRCSIGPGLFLPHTHGTVIGAKCIGCHSTIFHGVTLGAKYADLEFDPDRRPIVGDYVTLGAGAKILGDITLGNRSVIAANSLVVLSVPEGAFMIGVPAEQKGNSHAAEP